MATLVQNTNNTNNSFSCSAGTVSELSSTRRLLRRDSKSQLLISIRPEIRKGCLWEINLKFDLELVRKYNLQRIYLEKPRSAPRETFYLCLKVRSKLSVPRRELAFSKVAKIENETEKLELNEQGSLMIKVRFTQRPRAVFHKHSDVMILVVSLRTTKSDQPIVTDEHTLIFRGGTGSAHSADSRKKILESEAKLTVMTHYPNTTNVSSQSNSGVQTEVCASVPSGVNEIPTPQPILKQEDKEVSPTPLYDYTTGSSIVTDFLSSDHSPECAELFASFGLNTNSLSNCSIPVPLLSLSQVDPPLYPLGEPAPYSGVVDNNCPPNTSLSNNDLETQFFDVYPSLGSLETQNTKPLPPTIAEPISENYTLVFNRRRAKCSVCISECDVYQGSGGACSNCGCFPAQHIDLDKPAPPKPSKRKRSFYDSKSEDGDTENSDVEPPKKKKKSKYLLETRFYQKLFFQSLNFMTLEELSSIAKSAPLPFFVKDQLSVYKYVNKAFCLFILNTARTEQVLNKTPTQILGYKEGEDILKHDKYVLDREGEINFFSVSVHKQEYRVMKIYTTLRDGSKVVVGAVVSNF
eukprot:TRINITY_DN3825_c0_g2_i1.p1 TRINITY_DN3825_c0_g2~~TRINITY_DN3825_c0_g2_i1.p1  ORF type:complete len:578 (+),score=96.67 TRINITY_DN3825_c0_g2_i1:81-1814(+)